MNILYCSVVSALEKTQFFSCCIPNPYVDFVINALDSLKAFKDLFLAVEKWNRCFPCYYPDKQFLKIKINHLKVTRMPHVALYTRKYTGSAGNKVLPAAAQQQVMGNPICIFYLYIKSIEKFGACICKCNANVCDNRC